MQTLAAWENVEYRYGTVVTGYEGAEALTALRLLQTETGEDLLRLRDFVNQGEPETDGIPALLAKYGVEYVILYRQCGIPQDCLLRAGWHIAAGTDNYVLMTCADELSPTQQG